MSQATFPSGLRRSACIEQEKDLEKRKFFNSTVVMHRVPVPICMQKIHCQGESSRKA